MRSAGDAGSAAHRGASVVIPGDHQSPAVHALAHAMNAALGNVGKTVFYTDPVDANPVNQTDSLKELVADMRAGKVDMLFILGGNPVYDAPADLGFADALKNTNIPRARASRALSGRDRGLCQWHVNEAHYLEAWGDARAYDGTVSIVQPLIAPLYDGKSAHELIALLAGQAELTWPRSRAGLLEEAAYRADFDTFWRKSLHDGWIAGTAFAPKQVCAEGCNTFRVRRPATQVPSKSTSAAILRSTTGASPTTAGCRNCPSR